MNRNRAEGLSYCKQNDEMYCPTDYEMHAWLQKKRHYYCCTKSLEKLVHRVGKSHDIIKMLQVCFDLVIAGRS